MHTVSCDLATTILQINRWGTLNLYEDIALRLVVGVCPLQLLQTVCVCATVLRVPAYQAPMVACPLKGQRHPLTKIEAQLGRVISEQQGGSSTSKTMA